MIFIYQNTEFAHKLRRKTIRAMKLIALFTFAVIFQLHAEVHSQSFNFNETNTTVKQMFKQIEKNSKYSIFYRLDQVNLNQKINVVTSEGTIENVMSQVLRDQPLTFEVVDQVVVVKLSNSLNTDLRAIVKGQVTDVNGESLPGVSVRVKGSTLGTTTDMQGNFTLNVPDNGVFIFSYIGYVTQEIAVNGRSTINVTLLEDQQALGEVVVTALGIKREKKALGYSVGEVKGEDLQRVSQMNVLSALSGKVPGVVISQTSGPGSSVSMVIRGATSLSNDNQPLFVVDGVPVANGLNNVRRMGNQNQVDYGNAISDINPDDIESVSVLKGPSAAALYGSRAGNGVVLITTKSGKKGQGLGISVSTSNDFETPINMLDLHYRYANGSRNDRLDETSAYWSGPQLDVGNLAVQWNSPKDANGNKIATPLISYPDNMKNFLQTGITSVNNIAVSGATDKVDYRFSFNNMTNQGMIPNSDLNRNTISAATSYKFNKSLKLHTNLNFARSNSNNRPTTGNRGANPLQSVYNWPHVDIRDLKNYWVSEELQQLSPSSNRDNPYFLAYGVTNAFERNRVYGNVKLDWEIASGLSAFARISTDYFTENRQSKIPYSYSLERRGAYHLQDLSRKETNADFLVTYLKQLGDFSISVSGGGNSMTTSYMDRYMGSATGAGLTVPGLYAISNVPITGLSVSNGFSQKAIYSVYGMASIGFKDMLYIDLTARNDQSSTLPAENRSYSYPSASLSWLANNTFNLPKSVSLLKLRGGWAQAGNDTNPYQLTPTLGTGSWGSLITVGVPGTLLNPQLKPEIATSIEGGIDLNMFLNRLRFEGTYYNVENKNQILSVTTPMSSGFGSKLINAGLLASRGWEVALSGTPIKKTNGLTLDMGVNFTRNRTTLKELAPGIDFFTLWDDNNGGSFTYVGEEMGNLYSRGYAKVKDVNSPYYDWPILTPIGSYISMNNREDRVKVGNFNPRFLMGGHVTLSYKKLTVAAIFDWRAGGEFQSFTYRYAESDWKSQRQAGKLIPGGNYTPDQLVALLKSDPNKYIIPQTGWFPRVGGYSKNSGGMTFDLNNDKVLEYDGGFIPGVIRNADGTYRENLGGAGTFIRPISTVFPWSHSQGITFDASFVKLREISFAYQLPKIKGITNANISVYSRNILLWTAAKIGIDPERAFQIEGGAFRQGIELQNVMPWTIPVGFKLGFNF